MPKDYSKFLPATPALSTPVSAAAISAQFPGNLLEESDLIKIAHLCLADAYALLAVTFQAHWNVESPTFFSLHEAFNDQYDALVEAVDTLAEQIRQQNSYVQLNPVTVQQESGIEVPAAPQSALAWIEACVLGREKWAQDLHALQTAAANVPNLELQNVAIDLGGANRKAIWMLRSAGKSGS